jgi:flagellar hook-associated protein 1 FlgK
MLGAVYSIASTGLASVTKRSEITAQNISNASTEGYHKQVVHQSALTFVAAPFDKVGGAVVDRVSSTINYMLERQRFDLTAQKGYDTAIADTFDSFETGFTESVKQFNNALDNFKASLNSSANFPDNPGVVEATFGYAEQLSESFNRLMKDFKTKDAYLEQQEGLSLIEVNQKLDEVNKFNRQVGSSIGNGSYSGNMKSEVISSAQEAANTIGGTLSLNANFSIKITVGQKTIVDQGVFAPVTADDIEDATGSLGGLRRSRELLSGVKKDLKDAFKQFTDLINQTAVSGTTFGGQPGSPIYAYSETTEEYSMAITSSTNFAIGKDGKNALKMLGADTIENQSSFSNTMLKAQTFIGTEVIKTKSYIETTTTQLNAVNGQIFRESGVKLDEEAINLTNIRLEYQAMAKLIDTQTAMYDSIINLRA